jgi:EAL domain-containing protein (putative c-di-GMP-specific phosphodiesterase class I)
MEAFDVAEAVGRAAELDRLCRSVILSRASELPPGALLFINVLPNTLDQATLAGDKLLQEVQAAGISPDRIVLEITERLATSVPVVVREATRLGNQGFRLAIDDVGAGNSGLEMLRQLPVDFIKIDREVVARAQNDMSARGVFMAIVAFAKQTQAFVIAEGIETEAILDFVRQPTVDEASTFNGVQGAQGYLLGMPAKGTPPPTEDLVRPSQRTAAIPAQS